ncbi:hypothetical protein B0H14DRAFT_3610124 [Mycena olivaceomarginata]|nr:hypothetical protein B0H14DRAFT_3610124 [Mycena olivaceomarginata]
MHRGIATLQHHWWRQIWLRGGLPGKEDAKRIQGFTNQWSIYNKYPSFIDNEDITCKWNMKYRYSNDRKWHQLPPSSPVRLSYTQVTALVKHSKTSNKFDSMDNMPYQVILYSRTSGLTSGDRTKGWIHGLASHKDQECIESGRGGETAKATGGAGMGGAGICGSRYAGGVNCGGAAVATAGCCRILDDPSGSEWGQVEKKIVAVEPVGNRVALGILGQNSDLKSAHLGEHLRVAHKAAHFEFGIFSGMLKRRRIRRTFWGGI